MRGPLRVRLGGGGRLRGRCGARARGLCLARRVTRGPFRCAAEGGHLLLVLLLVVADRLIIREELEVGREGEVVLRSFLAGELQAPVT